jgi:antitoxin (DNA-binding transcriptional repressor) of toxin-antitoxin stability system
LRRRAVPVRYAGYRTPVDVAGLHLDRSRSAPLDNVTTDDYIRTMRVVGIRELKARLSEYLRDVRRGEVILVTDRNRVVAELRPPGTHAAPADDDVAYRLDELARSGDVQPSRLRKDGWTWRPPGLGLHPGTAARVLDSLREERGP